MPPVVDRAWLGHVHRIAVFPYIQDKAKPLRDDPKKRNLHAEVCSNAHKSTEQPSYVGL
jgi:hypothetical protein